MMKVRMREWREAYYHYSDRNPAEWNITVDKNVSRNRTKFDV
jgi:hypothetical protein